MASSAWFSVCLCLLVLCNGCLAENQSTGQQQQQRGECQIQNLNPLEPSLQIQHEAGVTEIWDQNNDQMQCAGVAATRHLIESRGLLLPSFNNAPMLVYVLQGRGIFGTTFPGCPETYQSFQPSQEGRQSQRTRDQHQKLHNIRRGDIIALPAGVAHWSYNNGGDQLVLVVVHDTNNDDNQLDQNLRRFFLAGNLPQQQQRQQGSPREQLHSGNNIFQGFDTNILAESFNVNMETARKLQNENDNRGFIVRVDKEFQLVRPPSLDEEEMEREYRRSNGFEETICSMRIKENIDDPERADVYTAQGGHISALNSLNLPILKHIQLSAERGLLHKNAMVVPHWNMNAHSIMYVTRGSGRIQIVGNSNRPAFDGEVRRGQLLIVPQNFAVVKQAGNDGLEWISIKTNDLAKISPLSGKTSVIRAMPEDVLANAYQISREEARSLKYNRQEVTILTRRSGSQGRPSA